jgi:hypothetical protein
MRFRKRQWGLAENFEKVREAMMVNYEENERALKELFHDLKSVPGTFPPVYTCGDAIIGYDRRGQIRVMASARTEPAGENGWLKRWQARLTPLAAAAQTEQSLIDQWIRRWHSRRWRLDKAAERPATG